MNRKELLERQREMRERMTAAVPSPSPPVKARKLPDAAGCARMKAMAVRRQALKTMCRACVDGDCLRCDGGHCRCVCSLELDRPRVREWA